MQRVKTSIIQETEGHTQRVAAMTVELARATGLNESEIMPIRLIAPEQSNPRRARYDTYISRSLRGGRRNYPATCRASAAVPIDRYHPFLYLIGEL
jgi:hypothetical protein